MLAGCTPWPPDLAERYRQKGYWEGRTLGDLVDRWAAAYGQREAIVSGEQRISYSELQRRVDRLAHHLLSLGLRPPERIVVQLPNVPEFIYLYYACAKIGVLPVMAFPAHRFAEISYLAQFSDAAAYAIPSVFRGYDYRPLAQQVRQATPCLRHVLVAGEGVPEDMVSLAELLTSPAPAAVPEPERLTMWRPDPADVALFLLSGGTTGLPKLIPRTHDDYAYNSRVSGTVCGIGPDTVYLVSLPIGHNFPLASPGIQSVFQNGGRVVLTDNADPANAFTLIEREHVTVTSLVPALAIRWLEAPERERFDLSSLRMLQVGGARLNPESARRIKPTIGCQLQQVFGMAEGLLNYTRWDDPEDEILGTQGRPCSPDDEVRIVDDRGNDVPLGQPGALLARGPYTIRGYYKAPEHNRQAFTSDGYYRTGDVVRQSRSGNFVVEGREKDMINRGGEKISAEEIENLILAHPSVLNVAVVAVPDPVLGERTCACIILKPAATLPFKDLLSFLERKQIAKFKLPERMELMESFPLTSVGKVSKKDLREHVARRLKTEGLG
jgi:2,3-dihydroxybenzoate-AMP ligase